MNIDTHTIDRIVAGVLNQLAADGEGPSTARPASSNVSETGHTAIDAKLITAEVLLGAIKGDARMIVGERAIVTPAAWDAAKERHIEIIRQSPRATPRGSATVETTQNQRKNGTHGALPVGLMSLLIVVRNTESVDRLWDDLQPTWRRELLSCSDDASALAISAICRGETASVAILADQTHRAACLANRNEAINAVAVSNAGDIRTIRKQLQANVWCLDPSNRSWFEVRNIFRAITDH